MSSILVDSVTYRYPEGKMNALENVSLRFEEGSFVAVLGSNGSGKSTLGKLLNALMVPSSGTILVDGLDSKEKNNVYSIRKSVGIVFQNPENQIVSDTVEEDVAFGPENIGLPLEEMQERIQRSLSAIGIGELASRKPDKLSGGQMQKVAIAGILALEPKFIVLDESTSMLDPKGRREVLEAVRRLQKDKGIGIILITHYMEEAVDADYVYVLDKGSLALEGTPREIFSMGKKLEELGLTLPPVSRMAASLRERGLSLPEGILRERELVEALRNLKEGSKC